MNATPEVQKPAAEKKERGSKAARLIAVLAIVAICIGVLALATWIICDARRRTEPMTASEYIQLIAMGIMAIAVVLLFAERLTSGRGLGARTIQLTSVFLIVPMILVLALQKVLSSETTATLIGALIGYVLSGIGDFRPEKKEEPNQTPEPTAFGRGSS